MLHSARSNPICHGAVTACISSKTSAYGAGLVPVKGGGHEFGCSAVVDCAAGGGCGDQSFSGAGAAGADYRHGVAGAGPGLPRRGAGVAAADRVSTAWLSAAAAGGAGVGHHAQS